MSGKWGITGYVVLSVITWGLATDPPLGKLKYFMKIMYVHKCASLIKWYFKMPYISPKKKNPNQLNAVYSVFAGLMLNKLWILIGLTLKIKI